MENTSSFNNLVLGNCPHTEKRKQNPHLSPFMKTNTKGKDQRPKGETCKTETCIRKHRQYLHDIGVGKDSLNRTSLAYILWSANDKWDFKLKIVSSTQLKKQSTRFSVSSEWMRIVASYTLDRELTSRVYKELKNLSQTKKQKTHLKDKPESEPWVLKRRKKSLRNISKKNFSNPSN